jgi:hypothetical protein
VKFFALLACGVTLLLVSPLVAAQRTLSWTDEQSCRYELKFDPLKYDERRLQNTVDLLITGYSNVSSTLPSLGNTISESDLTRYETTCAGATHELRDLALIDLPGIAEYRQGMLVTLTDQCDLNAARIRGLLGHPAALREYAPATARCSSFVDALEGKTDLRTRWREMVRENCQKNTAPAACERRFLTEESEPDALDRMRRDVINLGWHRCAIAARRADGPKKKGDPAGEALRANFKALFPIQVSGCDPNLAE